MAIRRVSDETLSGPVGSVYGPPDFGHTHAWQTGTLSKGYVVCYYCGEKSTSLFGREIEQSEKDSSDA